MTLMAMGAGGAVAVGMVFYLLLRRSRLCGRKQNAANLAADLYQTNYGGPQHVANANRGRGGGSIGTDANRARGGGSVGHVGQLFSAELGGDGAGGALPPMQTGGGVVVRYEGSKRPAKCDRGVSGRCMTPGMLAMMSRFKSKERRLGADATTPPGASPESRVRMYNIRQEDRVSSFDGGKRRGLRVSLIH